MSKGRAALENAAISFGDHSAKGSLALDMAGSRAVFEGTLAYDTLDLTAAWMADKETDGASEMRPLAALPFASRDEDRSLDFDMRISADRFRAGSFETGPLALALTATRDRLSVDVAEMALFGGNAVGRLDVDPSQPAALLLRGNGSQLDMHALANALQLPFNVNGPVTVRIGLTLPLTTKPPIQDLGAAAGTFAVQFPAGGSLDGDMPRTLSAALAHQDLDWGLGEGSFPFAGANIDGTVLPGKVDLDVQGASGDKSIGGRLRIAFPGAAVSGTLSVSQNPDAAGDSLFTSAPAASAVSTQLVLSGTAAEPIFSPPGKPSLSN